MAGIAEQAKDERVGLTGAGSEKDAFRRDFRSVGVVVLGHGFACAQQALGLGLVAHGLRGG